MLLSPPCNSSELRRQAVDSTFLGHIEHRWTVAPPQPLKYHNNITSSVALRYDTICKQATCHFIKLPSSQPAYSTAQPSLACRVRAISKAYSLSSVQELFIQAKCTFHLGNMEVCERVCCMTVSIGRY